MADFDAPAEIQLTTQDVERVPYLEIRDRFSRELVTVLEMLSPSNKRGDVIAASTSGASEASSLRVPPISSRSTSYVTDGRCPTRIGPSARILWWSAGRRIDPEAGSGRSSSGNDCQKSRFRSSKPDADWRASTSKRFSTTFTTYMDMKILSIQARLRPHSLRKMYDGQDKSWETSSPDGVRSARKAPGARYSIGPSAIPRAVSSTYARIIRPPSCQMSDPSRAAGW